LLEVVREVVVVVIASEVAVVIVVVLFLFHTSHLDRPVRKEPVRAKHTANASIM